MNDGPLTKGAWWVIIGFIVAIGLIVLIALGRSSSDDSPATVELTEEQLLALSIATVNQTAQAIEDLEAREQQQAIARQEYLEQLRAEAVLFGTAGAQVANAETAAALAAQNEQLRVAREELKQAVAAAGAALEADAAYQAQLQEVQDAVTAVDATLADAIAVGQSGDDEAARALQAQGLAIQDAGEAINSKLAQAEAAAAQGNGAEAVEILESIEQDLVALEASLAQ